MGSWHISWQGKYSSDALIVHGKTRDQAIEDAKYFGAIFPKWWQFWLKKPNVFKLPS